MQCCKENCEVLQRLQRYLELLISVLQRYLESLILEEIADVEETIFPIEIAVDYFTKHKNDCARACEL